MLDWQIYAQFVEEGSTASKDKDPSKRIRTVKEAGLQNLTKKFVPMLQMIDASRDSSSPKIKNSSVSLVQTLSDRPQSYLTLFGISPLTAYFGLLEVGRPKEGEVCVISAAAGAAGSMACQLAKHYFKLKVIGIVGSDEKLNYLLNDLECCDAVINYKKHQRKEGKGGPEGQGRAVLDPKSFSKVIKETVKKVQEGRKAAKVDIYFDNVGGIILDVMFGQMANFGRIIACGAISTYNSEAAASQKQVGGTQRRSADGAPKPAAGMSPANSDGLTEYPNIVSKRLTFQGFVVLDYAKQYPDAFMVFVQLYKEGKLVLQEDIYDGLENAPAVMRKLYQGENIGKLMLNAQKQGSKL